MGKFQFCVLHEFTLIFAEIYFYRWAKETIELNNSYALALGTRSSLINSSFIKHGKYCKQKIQDIAPAHSCQINI